MVLRELLPELESTDLTRRERAAHALQMHAVDGLGLPFFLDALQHSKGRVRREALRAIGTLAPSDDSTLEALCTSLSRRSDREKHAAAQALIQIGPSSEAILLQTLHTASLHTKRWIFKVLGHIGTKASVETLRSEFQSHGGAVEKYAARALGRLDFKATLHMLSSESRSGWSNDARAEKAHRGLIQLGVVAPHPCEIIESTVIGSDALTAFEIAQGKGNRMVLRGAIRGLGERRDTSSIPYLLDAIEYEDAPIQKEAGWALCKIGGETVRTGLLCSLASRRLATSTRIQIAETVGQLKGNQAKRALEDYLLAEDEEPTLRIAILRILLRGTQKWLQNNSKEHSAPEQHNRVSTFIRCLGSLAAHDSNVQSMESERICTRAVLYIRRYSEKAYVTNEHRMAWLREILSQPPSIRMIQCINSVLLHWNEQDDRQMAIDYANQHIVDWRHELPTLPLIEEEATDVS